MAVLSLPLTFNNSFWTQDYRKGLEVLYQRLEQGTIENDEIVAFIRARAVAESQLAAALTNPSLTGAAGTGFGADDGATLLMAFRGLQRESIAQGEVHKSIATELETLVADPFDDWAQVYKERLLQNKSKVIENWLRSYELAHGEVAKLKHQYLSKTRRADEAADDAKFAPNAAGDNYTTSPRLRPVDGRAGPQRSASVSERITERLKQLQLKNSAPALSSTAEETKSEVEDEEEKPLPKVDKGKGRAIDEGVTSPPRISSPAPLSPLSPSARHEMSSSPMPPMPPPPMLLAGLSLPPSAVSQLLTRAAGELPLRPVRFPLLGEYQDCFTGEEFVAWLNESVDGFGGSLDRAEDAARDLTERDGLLRRIGEFGNQFEHSDDAFYQFRPKAFDIEGNNSAATVGSPVGKTLQLPKDNILKRTNTLVSLVTKVINNNSEPAHIKARREAQEADQVYRVAVRQLDRQRLGLEERLEDTLKTLQRWEAERLRAVKSVLLQYQGTLANLPKTFEPSIERSATVIAAYQPESDLMALIERYRTGPFRPEAQVYESVSHDESDVVFGIDLRKWAEGGWSTLMSNEEKKDLIPPVITALLDALTELYRSLPNDAERRKTWIYEVPLPAVHHLREALNAVPPEQPIPTEMLLKFDAPIIASGVKLWALELDPPLALYEGWEDFRRLYPTVGSSAAKPDEESNEEARIRDIGAALQRLPRVHLYVLDALIKHLKTLIDTTTVEEPNEVYITKLALSLGRTILRPKFESPMSIQDRHPTLLFIDLIKNYDLLLPPTIARKKRESERKIPIRKRTAPIDMRLSRSRISIGADMKQLLVAQQVAQNPSLVRSPKSPPPVPAIPATLVNSVAPATDAKVTPPPAAIPAPDAAPAHAPVPAGDQNNLPPRPSFKEPPPEDDAPPARPSFKEPPSEADEAAATIPKFADPPAETENTLPLRPTFTEPPPEAHDSLPMPKFTEPAPEIDDSPLPMPKFVDPPAELDDAPLPMPKFVDPPAELDDAPLPMPKFTEPAPEDPVPSTTAIPSTAVVPPTPLRRQSILSSRSGSPSPTKIGSRSPSPGADDLSLKTGVTRSSSGTSPHIRGPRISRGPRAPTGGGVGSIVSALNRNSVSAIPSPSSSGFKRMSSPPARPTSGLGRSAFSRRTMASDAEDDIVDRK